MSSITSSHGMLRSQDSVICDFPKLLKDTVVSPGMGVQLPGGSGWAALEVSHATWTRDGCCPLDPSGQPKNLRLAYCPPDSHSASPSVIRILCSLGHLVPTPRNKTHLPLLHSPVTSASKAKDSACTGPHRLCDFGQVTAPL